MPSVDLARARLPVEVLQVKERAQEPGPVEALLFQRQGRAAERLHPGKPTKPGEGLAYPCRLYWREVKPPFW